MEHAKLRSKYCWLEVVRGCVSVLCQCVSVFLLVLLIILCCAGDSRPDSENEVEATDYSVSVKQIGLYFHHEDSLEDENRVKVQGVLLGQGQLDSDP